MRVKEIICLHSDVNNSLVDELCWVVPQNLTRVGTADALRHSGINSTSFAINDVLPDPGSPIRIKGLQCVQCWVIKQINYVYFYPFNWPQPNVNLYLRLPVPIFSLRNKLRLHNGVHYARWPILLLLYFGAVIIAVIYFDTVDTFVWFVFDATPF